MLDLEHPCKQTGAYVTLALPDKQDVRAQIRHQRDKMPLQTMFVECDILSACCAAGKGPFEVANKELTCALILWGTIEQLPDKMSMPCISFIKASLTAQAV